MKSLYCETLCSLFGSYGILYVRHYAVVLYYWTRHYAVAFHFTCLLWTLRCSRNFTKVLFPGLLPSLAPVG
jgi:hypothetical protein